jgi:hypothetical protein
MSHRPRSRPPSRTSNLNLAYSSLCAITRRAFRLPPSAIRF